MSTKIPNHWQPRKTTHFKGFNKQVENKKSTMKWCVVFVQRTRTILWITWDEGDTVIIVGRMSGAEMDHSGEGKYLWEKYITIRLHQEHPNLTKEISRKKSAEGRIGSPQPMIKAAIHRTESSLKTSINFNCESLLKHVDIKMPSWWLISESLPMSVTHQPSQLNGTCL